MRGLKAGAAVLSLTLTAGPLWAGSFAFEMAASLRIQAAMTAHQQQFHQLAVAANRPIFPGLGEGHGGFGDLGGRFGGFPIHENLLAHPQAISHLPVFHFVSATAAQQPTSAGPGSARAGCDLCAGSRAGTSAWRSGSTWSASHTHKKSAKKSTHSTSSYTSTDVQTPTHLPNTQVILGLRDCGGLCDALAYVGGYQQQQYPISAGWWPTPWFGPRITFPVQNLMQNQPRDMKPQRPARAANSPNKPAQPLRGLPDPLTATYSVARLQVGTDTGPAGPTGRLITQGPVAVWTARVVLSGLDLLSMPAPSSSDFLNQPPALPPLPGPLGPGSLVQQQPADRTVDSLGDPALPSLADADLKPRLLENLAQEKPPAARMSKQPELERSVEFELLAGPPALPAGAVAVRSNLEGDRLGRAQPQVPVLAEKIGQPPPLSPMPTGAGGR
jgi:hypothetical protein